MPNVEIYANSGSETVCRTLNGRGLCRRSGIEMLNDISPHETGLQIKEEALELLFAPDTPREAMDLLIDSDQMMLQIHESIGHPIELDRILGDERNYAGTSFVTMDMFGKFQYGSSLLNVSFDPMVPMEFASYAHDDDGHTAERTMLIENGVLIRPLGSHLSAHRAGVDGVANSRACSWNRPPIDRMANLNVEPGSSTLQEMIQSIDKGIYMKTNQSWSIDDSRNKFQFGCEWGQLIENGKLTTVVKNPNYRGTSREFWKSLSMVGDATTLGTFGTPHCGKGEPNQAIRVGHRSPACVFNNIEVFGSSK